MAEVTSEVIDTITIDKGLSKAVVATMVVGMLSKASFADDDTLVLTLVRWTNLPAE